MSGNKGSFAVATTLGLASALTGEGEGFGSGVANFSKGFGIVAAPAAASYTFKQMNETLKYGAKKTGAYASVTKYGNRLFNPQAFSMENAKKALFTGANGGRLTAGLGFKGGTAAALLPLGIDMAFGDLSQGTRNQAALPGGISQNDIDNGLSYLSYIPGIQLHTATARTGLRVGNAAYKGNWLGARRASDSVANALYKPFYGEDFNLNDDKKISREQNKHASNYFEKLRTGKVSEAKIQTNLEAIERLKKGKVEREQMLDERFKNDTRFRTAYRKDEILPKLNQKDDENIKKLSEEIEELQKAIREQAEQQAEERYHSASEGGGGNQTITIELSLKDTDKIPDLLTTQVIEPLRQQIAALRKDFNRLNVDSPQPSEVS
jgi:hypothetical protein